MISFRLRTKWQNCRGYVPRYERTPKIGWFDIHSVFATHVETVVLLSKLDVNQHIKVELEMDELDLTTAESKATYEEIKDFVFKTHAMKVSNLYISQVKKKCGLEVGKNYNVSNKENPIVPNCPPEKEEAIREALEYFKMI